MADRYEKIDPLALQVLSLSKNSLIINLRFMDSAISMLEQVALHEFGNVTVDGESIGYDPVFVLKSYKKDKALPVRQYLHMVLHCVFQHYYINTLLDHEAWDLACDIAVENSINGLELDCVTTDQSREEQDQIDLLKEKVKYMTAESLYHYFREKGISAGECVKLRRLFSMDDHSIWYESNRTIKKAAVSDAEVQMEIKNTWQKISEQMQIDIDAFSKRRGDQTKSLVQNLCAVNREKYDYEAFLKKFATRGEVMKVNDDEFDYIFYTYGLQLYKKVPLIEPLEYKEVERIREFVIAIDTSGSTSGSLVQTFIQKTYNILKQQESFFAKINLHIVQCDNQIQECVKITNQDEFDEYMKNMKIHGLGGTDFRPVFAYVDRLIEQHEFQNLKGMIYFTDGEGTFPGKQPDYQVAIVYVEEEYENPEVPVWAIKLVLKPDEIEEERQ
jgi:predicted metal-dependent peptidase